MSILEIILLGLIQGFTEFFPVSSSGHLLIGKILLQTTEYGILVDIILHLGTLLSIVIYWRFDLKNQIKDICSGKLYLLHLLFLGSIPAAIIGLTLKDFIEINFFNSLGYAVFPFFLIINYFFMSIIIFISKRYHDNVNTKITYFHAILIGIAQAIAVMP